MSSDHRSLQGALPWYAAGTLDEAERRRVDEHLAGCEACRQQLAEIRGLADLGAQAPVERALEHVAPGLLVEYAERREDLDPETVSWIEGRLADCAVCREAFANLQDVEAALADADASPAPTRAATEQETTPPLLTAIWDWLSSTMLRPAPALAYLLIAAVGLPLLWSLRGPGDPVAAVQAVTVTGERALREGPTVVEPLTIELEDARRPVVIELLTDLRADDLRPGGLAFNVELSAGDRPVWSQHRDAADFALRDERAVLSLLLDPRALRLDQAYRLAIRADRPGDPLDGQALFVRHLRFKKK